MCLHICTLGYSVKVFCSLKGPAWEYRLYSLSRPFRHSCCHGEAGWHPEGGAQGGGGGSEGQSGERSAAVQGHSLKGKNPDHLKRFRLASQIYLLCVASQLGSSIVASHLVLYMCFYFLCFLIYTKNKYT